MGKNPDFTIKEVEDEKIKEKIFTILGNYMGILQRLTMDKDYYRKFKDNPRPELEDTGMEIPSYVEVKLDDNLRWPVIELIATDDSGREFKVKEKELGIEVVEKMSKPGSTPEKIWGELKEFKQEGKTVVELDMAHTQLKTVLIMPYIDPYLDELGEVKFNDGEEIILTSC